MINVVDLTVARGQRTIVKNISFTVSAGEIHVISGPNGSGKSTLLSTLAGDLSPTTGSVHLGGDNLRDLSDQQQAQRRAVLSQRPVLFPYTAAQYLALVDRQRIALELPSPEVAIDVSDLLNQKLTTMSGGQIARVMLAGTLAQGARTLLLDEPTAAFDRGYRDHFIQWLGSWRDLGYATVLVTHDERLEDLADSVTTLA